MPIKQESFVLPENWAVALMYGDDSGLSDEEIDAIDSFVNENLEVTDLFECSYVESGDGDFMRYHDASHLFPFASNVATFTFRTGLAT